MKYYYQATYDLNSLPNCCGIVEAGDFDMCRISEEYKKRYPTNYRDYSAETPEEAWVQALKGLKEHAAGRPIQFWFVKYHNDDDDSAAEEAGDSPGEFRANALRELVMKEETQVYLGTFVNPNTSNIIEGYMIKHNCKEIKE